MKKIKIMIALLVVTCIGINCLALTKTEKVLLLKEYYKFEPNSPEYIIANLQSEILDLDKQHEVILQSYDYNTDGAVDMQDLAYFSKAYRDSMVIRKAIEERINRLKVMQVGK